MENKPATMLTINQIPPRYNGVSQNALRTWTKSGTLPHVKIGNKILINEAVLAEFLKGNNQTNQSENIKI